MNLKHWVIGALSIIIVSYLLPGVEVTLAGSFILAIVLGLINIFIKPLVFLLTLPINILTLGLFSLVINAALIIFASKITPGFAVSSFWSALLFSVLLSIVTTILGKKSK